MRKKSHILLAKYLINNANEDKLADYKKSFYIGSILPDCVPSFITQRHCIEETFSVLQKEVTKIINNYDVEKGIDRYYCRHLGVVVHHLADFFTFPHNAHFPGNVKEHCVYEGQLKHSLREYIKSINEDNGAKVRQDFKSVDDLYNFIERMHQEYQKIVTNFQTDCRYITDMCLQAVNAVMQIIEYVMQNGILIKTPVVNIGCA